LAFHWLHWLAFCLAWKIEKIRNLKTSKKHHSTERLTAQNDSQHSTARHGTAQHSTAQHSISTAQHRTAQAWLGLAWLGLAFLC
jgi:multidrug resistance efflux pump